LLLESKVFLYRKDICDLRDHSYDRFYCHKQDEEVDLYYMVAWRYAAKFGRFLSVDPLADEFAGWTPYHYVHNNLLIFVDQDGKAAMNSNCCYGLPGSSFERYVGGFFDYAVDRTTTNVQNAATEAGNATLQMVYDEKIGDGLQMAMEGFQEADGDKSLVGVQTLLDGVADVAGRVETVSALGTLNPKTAPVALPLFGVSSTIASASDIGATAIEGLRFLNGNSTVGNTVQRAGWTLLNYSIPGRISSKYQGREQAAEGTSRAVITQTQNALRED